MYNKATLTQQGYRNRNHVTGRFYLGILNQKKLKEAGFSTPERLTFFQARSKGLKIKEGSKGVVVKFEDKLEVEERNGDRIEKKTVPYIKYHTLFNVEQTEPLVK